MKKSVKLCLSVGFFPSMLLAAPCRAQSVEEQSSNQPQSPQVQPVEDSQDASEGVRPGLGDIVVTAQRRSENLQRVPIAITAANQLQLDTSGIKDTSQLNSLVPGLNVRSTTGAYQPSIRGIGTSASVVENPVALYIDGVYLPQQREGVRELNDVEQIAVLKGPQGTLFGRNATGGVIQITTRAPSQHFAAEINVRRENYDGTHVDGYVTGGLTDSISASLSAEYSHQGDGWGTDLSTGNDTYRLAYRYGGRAKIRFQPDEDTDITLIGDYSNWKQFGSDFQAYPGTSFVYTGDKPVYSVYDTRGETDGVLGFEGGGISLNVSHSFGFAKLVSITAYRTGSGMFDFDFSGATPTRQRTISTDQPSRSFTQEIQLLSRGSSKLNWVIGTYFFHYLNATNDLARLRIAPIAGPGRFFSSGQEIADSVAPFAQADWEFLPSTKITLGARFTYEKRSISGRTNSGSFTPGPPVREASVTINKPTFRAALTHEFDGGTLLYASFNSGIKSGGFNVISPTAPAYLPEKINAYEAGFKSQLFDRRLRLNVGGFYYDYANIQVNRLTAAGQIVVNGAGARLYGVDADFNAVLGGGFQLSGGLEAMHATFTKYPDGITSVPNPAGGATIVVADLKGRRLPLSQKLSGNVALDYETAISIGTIHVNVTANYNGQYYFEPDNFLQQKAYTLLNASIKYTLPNDRYSVSFWGKNLLDEKVISMASSLAQGYPTAYGNAPLTYGLTLQAKF